MLLDELLGVLLDELLEELLDGVLEELEEPLKVVEGVYRMGLEGLFNQPWCSPFGTLKKPPRCPLNEWPIGPPKELPPLKPWPTKPPPWPPRPLKKYPVPAPTLVWPCVAPTGRDAPRSFLIAAWSLASVVRSPDVMPDDLTIAAASETVFAINVWSVTPALWTMFV